MSKKPAKKAAKKTTKKAPAKKTAAKKKASPTKPRQKATGPYANNNPEPRQHIAETAPEPAQAPVKKAEEITDIILEKPSWRARLTGFFKN